MGLETNILTEYCASVGFPLESEQIKAFENYKKALYDTNKVMNLTRVPESDSYLRHFVDSLLIVDLIPRNARVLDIGTGPGLPAWPLACVRPDITVTALDSSTKMIEFLKTVPLSNLVPIQIRAEDFDQRERFQIVTGRAIAPLSLQLEMSAPYCVMNGFVIPFRTLSDEDEIKRFPAHKLNIKLDQIIHRTLPTTEITRVFPLYKKTGLTSFIYPRPWSMMKRSPL